MFKAIYKCELLKLKIRFKFIIIQKQMALFLDTFTDIFSY
jgi:restriction endonuclease S subunit